MKNLIRLTLLFLLLLATLAMPVFGNDKSDIELELSKRHRVSGLNSRFNYSNMSFEQYIQHMQKVILKSRVDITGFSREKILKANSPYEWSPDKTKCAKNKKGRYQNGIFMIHGLTDSPSSLHDIASVFLKRCFLVRGILLPGHGTVPGDLIETTHKEWLKATKYGIDRLKMKVENVFLSGFSTGGTLSLYYAFRQEPIKALFLFSPAIEIKSKAAFLSGWVNSISWISDGTKWLEVKKDEDIAKYESFPTNAAAEVYELTGKLRNLAGSKKLPIPMFIAISDDDTTISAEGTLKFFKKQPNKKSRLILFTNRSDNHADGRISPFPSKHDQLNVINQSHLSIINNIDNTHYGINGDYRNCLHYNYGHKMYESCKNDGSVMWGENSEENIIRHTSARITFNPDFAYLTDRINQFLSEVENQ